MSRLLLLQSRIARGSTVVLILGIAIILQLLLYPDLGVTASAVLVLPVLAGAWYFGNPAAILLAMVGMGINFLAGYLDSKGIWNAYPWHVNLAGGIINTLAGLVFASLGKLTREQHRVILEHKEAAGSHHNHTGFLTLLNDIVCASLEAQNLDALLLLLTERISELFSADDCFITIWDEVAKTTVPVAPSGHMSQSSRDVPAWPGQQALTSSALEVGHALVVEDTANTPYFDKNLTDPFPELHSVLGLPLIAGERKLGAVILGYHEPHSFTAKEIGQGELAARQISLAMMKVILLDETRQRLGELAGLHAIAQSFSPQGEEEETFGLLTEIVASLMQAKICLVALRDHATDEIHGQASAFGLPDELAASFRYKSAHELEIQARSSRAVFQIDSPEEFPGELQVRFKSLGMKNLLAAPLWDSNQNLVGLLITANKANGFGKDDIHLLEILAGQVAVVGENTRLLAAERRRAKELTVLNRISVIAAEAHNEGDLIEQATLLIGKQLYPDNFGVMLLDEKKRDLYLHSSYRMGSRESLFRVQVGTGITGSVAQTGKMRYIYDIRGVSEYINADDRILSELCVPLKIGEKVIGVINAESAQVGAFTQEDEKIMGILANQLAVAIQRLRTADIEYHHMTMIMRSNALIRVLAQVGARAAAAPDPEGVMRTLGEELAKMGLTCLVALPKSNHTMSIAYSTIPNRMMQLLQRTIKSPISEVPIPSERMLVSTKDDYQPRLLREPLTAVQKILVDFSEKSVNKIMVNIGVADNIPLCHLPLVCEGQLQGVLWLWGEGLRESDLPTLSIFSNQVAIALQNSRLLNEVHRLAITDEGTGIYNRRHFFAMAEKEFSRAHRYKHTLTALIVDVDNFKAFNDRHGHVAGDQVLRQVAQTLKKNLRDGDILGRYGGEEFSILLPFTNLGTAQQVAERLCKQVSATRVRAGGKRLGVTVSIGLAELVPEIKTLLGLVDLADQAMYAAKEEGGNRIYAR